MIPPLSGSPSFCSSSEQADKNSSQIGQCHLNNDNGQDTRKRLSTREESASVSFLLLREKEHEK